MNILEREENKTIDVIYFHTEGGAIGTETNELVVPSSNLIDFFLEVANQVDRSEIIFPRINMKRKVFFKNIVINFKTFVTLGFIGFITLGFITMCFYFISVTTTCRSHISTINCKYRIYIFI